jgi:hypothetical protein
MLLAIFNLKYLIYSFIIIGEAFAIIGVFLHYTGLNKKILGTKIKLASDETC